MAKRLTARRPYLSTLTLVGCVFSQAIVSLTPLAPSLAQALVVAVRRANSSDAPAAVPQSERPLNVMQTSTLCSPKRMEEYTT